MRVSEEGAGYLAKPDLHILKIFHGELLTFSVQNLFHGSCLAVRISVLYRFLKSLKRELQLSLRTGFLHLLTLRFTVFTCFLKAFSFGDNHGTYFVFGKNDGMQVSFIPPERPIVLIAVSGFSFVAELFTRSSHCLCCSTFAGTMSSCLLGWQIFLLSGCFSGLGA